jgi:primosomal replication protein N
MNNLSITATLVSVSALRYTPAGVPVIELVLEHTSEQVEAGHTRQVRCTLAAIAAGEQATWLKNASLGECHTFEGFLAARTKQAKQPVLHVTASRAEPMPKPNA